MEKIFLSFLDWIYKKKCYCCGSSKECVPLCSDCYGSFAQGGLGVNRIIEGANVYVAGMYEKNIQKVIRAIKYHRRKDLGYYIAKFMFEYFSELGCDKDFMVVPVPMFYKRQKKRKYNHMDIIAEEFCRMGNFQFENGLISRIKDTKPQYKLSRGERIKNLENAFAVDVSKYNGKPILILDDICSTGSTFEGMIKELHKYGIEDITCFSASAPML